MAEVRPHRLHAAALQCAMAHMKYCQQSALPEGASDDQLYAQELACKPALLRKDSGCVQQRRPLWRKSNRAYWFDWSKRNFGAVLEVHEAVERPQLRPCDRQQRRSVACPSANALVGVAMRRTCEKLSIRFTQNHPYLRPRDQSPVRSQLWRLVVGFADHDRA